MNGGLTLWDMECFLLAVLDELANSHDQISAEINGKHVGLGKVSIAVRHKEEIHLAFGLETSRELFDSQSVLGVLTDLIIVCVHIYSNFKNNY